MLSYTEIKSGARVLRGMRHYNINNRIRVPVVIVHGYLSANKIGPYRLFVHIAEALAQNGFPAFRFDLSGMGESDGEISDIKYDDHCDDLCKIIEYVSAQYGNKPVMLVAHCMGCNFALNVMKKMPEKIVKAILLAPFFTTDTTLESLFDADEIAELKGQHFTHRKGSYVDDSFFCRTKIYDFIEEAAELREKVVAIVPQFDQFTPLDTSVDALNVARVKTVLVENADHNFLTQQERLIDKILDQLND